METGRTVNILYFARVAELVGKRNESWHLEKDTTGNSFLTSLKFAYPQLNTLSQLYFSVNHAYAKEDTLIEPGDEIAVFEAVTGG